MGRGPISLIFRSANGHLGSDHYAARLRPEQVQKHENSGKQGRMSLCGKPRNAQAIPVKLPLASAPEVVLDVPRMWDAASRDGC